MKKINEYCDNCNYFNLLECLECTRRVGEQDLLERIEALDEFMSHSEVKPKTVSLNVTRKELTFIKMWIKTAYANEDFLNEVLGLDKRR